jgi:hypothetical protein
MQVINRMADRLLSAVVPKITAGACCPKDTTLQFCYCVALLYAQYRYCSYNCSCQVVCGGCNVTEMHYSCH